MMVWNYLQTLFSKVKVQKQLLSIFFIAVLIPTAIIGTILLLNNQKLLTHNFENQVKLDNLRTKSIMFDVTTNLYNTSENLVSDNNLHKFLIELYSNKESQTYIDGYNHLQTVCKNDTSISSLKIYTLKKATENFEYLEYADDTIKKTDWFIKAIGQANVFWQSRAVEDSLHNKSHELILYRKIPLPEIRSYAVLEINVSNNYLKNRISNNLLSSTVSVNQDPVFFSTQRKQIGLNSPVYINYQEEYYQFLGKLKYNDSTYMGNISTLKPYRSNDKIYIIIIDSQAYSYVNKITLSYFIIVIIIILLPTIFVYLFIKYFSGRVITLRGAMYKASCGNYDIVDSFNGDDELSETFNDLSIMIHKIKEKEASIYMAQINEQKITNRQQQMEFKMLASQINPHFLYNTLEMIRMKALNAGNKEVSTAIKLLGKSMHYVLNNVGTVSTTLNKELEHIKTYLAIQKLRFYDRINYIIDIQKDLKINTYNILPLLLQPIVENAILHGLECIEKDGQIILEIFKKGDDFLYIKISDNGIGMVEKELTNVLYNINHHDKTSSHSIGLYNINQRIKLFYGEIYGISLESTQNKGTTATITLPLNNKKGEN
ncbi:MAG: histidine kinase [Clostridiales bacterium]